MARSLRNLIFDFPDLLDTWLRRRDLALNRINTSDRGFSRGYSSASWWLPIPVLVLLAYGLLHWRGWPLAIACTATVAIHLVLCRRLTGRLLPRAQWLLLVGLALAVWWLAGPESREADPAPYRQIYALLGALLLTVALPASRWWADWLIGGQRENLRQVMTGLLDKTQLFVHPYHPPANWLRIVRAYTLVPLSAPFLLAVFPAAATIVVPRELVSPIFWLALFSTWAILAAGFYNGRLRAFRNLLHQMFLAGGPGVVSAIVIVLAATRLAGVEYVTTVLDQASWTVLAGGIVMLYLLFWLYDYWSQRALAEVLLGLLDPKEDHPSEVGYRGHRLQIHGAGRLIALREVQKSYREIFETYRPMQVFEVIYDQLEGRARADQADWDEVDLVADAVAGLGQKVRLYRAIPGILLAALLLWGASKVFNLVQSPGLVADVVEVGHAGGESKNGGDAVGFDLGRALQSGPADQPVYAIAASGGGTRAALYTYSVLRAFHARDLGDRLVLLSGVSGGSLGVAYYAAYRETLGGNTENWSRFRQAVAAPYIQEVLAAAGESRFLRGARLGQALTESFERCFYDKTASCDGPAGDSFHRTVGELSGDGGVGLIFNASIVGSWRPHDPQPSACVAEGARPRDCGTIEQAGGRMAITNLAGLTSAGGAAGPSGWPLDFPYVVVGDPDVPLVAAAALSANFPPVFSNAEVRLREGESEARYWVTDGGAVENRGVLSLLLALRAELAHLEEPTDLAPLVIFVAEASGLSVRYQEDRGTGAKFAAARQIANRLVSDLLHAVDARYRQITAGRAGVDLVYLPMPDTFRSGFGTHWQMPDAIEVQNPTTWYLKPRTWWRRSGAPTLTLSQQQILRAVDALFAENRAGADLDPRLWDWIAAGADGDPRDRLARSLPR